METRPASLRSRFFHAIGLGAEIPKPNGKYLVRSTHFRIPGEEHGVLTQIFFPVKQTIISTNNNNNSVIVPRAYRNGVLTGFSYFSSAPKFLFDIFLGNSPHPLADIPKTTEPIFVKENSIPCIFFSHGLAGNCEVYTKTCMDLASNGFVVVALEHEDGSGSFAKSITGDVVKYQKPPSGLNYTREEVIEFRKPFLQKRENEILNALNFFTRNNNNDDFDFSKDISLILKIIDKEKIFISGHSFGAASSVKICQKYPEKFKACILMDLWPFPIPNLEEGIQIPTCVILSEPFAQSSECELTRSLVKNCPKLKFAVYLQGTVHSSFSDCPFWAPAFISKRFGLRGSLDPIIAQDSFNQLYISFLNNELVLLDNNNTSIITDAAASADVTNTKIINLQEILQKLQFKSIL